ncbi:hypothetical protein B7494_g1068 [Chlorociboria aeruginascens]|nr:hypothetical protein B7494_g1068 [Chlorociboria aeruginascens]
MRFLCLHGFGTNSDIFEVQISQIRERLGSWCEFVFLDGELECEPADGISRIFPGPYLCYHPKVPTVSELTSARALVLSVLEEEGPFDGIVGFSQGAALAASLILQHSTQAQALVSCAIFFCGGLPWMLRSEVVQFHQRYPDFKPQSVYVPFPRRIVDCMVDYGDMFPENEDETPPAEEVRWMHPARSPLRFPVPTAFIQGGKADEHDFQAGALAQMGSEEHGVKVFNHEAGHVIPRGDAVTEKMIETMMWSIERGLFRA